jgi:hypothetical protein
MALFGVAGYLPLHIFAPEMKPSPPHKSEPTSHGTVMEIDARQQDSILFQPLVPVLGWRMVAASSRCLDLA